jgi:LysM repeat protein
MKVSKVVLIVVALHVLVIGGIFIFEGCSRAKSNVPAVASDETPANPAEGMTPTAPDNQMASIPNPQGPPTASTLTPAAPVTTSAETTAPASSSRTYVVKKGDSLWKVAKLENVSVGELARANKLTKTSALKIGQKLTVPAGKTQTPTVATATVAPISTDAAAAPSAATDVSGANYTVKSGDSLWKVARQQNVTVAAIKQANNLSSDSLKVGQKLKIPAASATAAAPAQTVSAGIASTSATAWREPGTYTENGQTIHVVDFNESPVVIAKKYGIKMDDLLKANNLSDPKKIQYGQRLVIPLSPANPAPTPQASATVATPVANTVAAPAPAAPIVSASRTTVQ